MPLAIARPGDRGLCEDWRLWTARTCPCPCSCLCLCLVTVLETRGGAPSTTSLWLLIFMILLFNGSFVCAPSSPLLPFLLLLPALTSFQFCYRCVYIFQLLSWQLHLHLHLFIIPSPCLVYPQRRQLGLSVSCSAWSPSTPTPTLPLSWLNLCTNIFRA